MKDTKLFSILMNLEDGNITKIEAQEQIFSLLGVIKSFCNGCGEVHWLYDDNLCERCLKNKQNIIDNKLSKNLYIFYSEKTNHDDHDDVAITEAENLDDAIIIFEKYYLNVNEENVKIIDCNNDHIEGMVKGIMIVSKY